MRGLNDTAREWGVCEWVGFGDHWSCQWVAPSNGVGGPDVRVTLAGGLLLLVSEFGSRVKLGWSFLDGEFGPGYSEDSLDAAWQVWMDGLLMRVGRAHGRREMRRGLLALDSMGDVGVVM